MKTFYVLISPSNGLHYGYTFDEELAKTEATQLERRLGYRVDVYEFYPSDEFEKEG